MLTKQNILAQFGAVIPAGDPSVDTWSWQGTPPPSRPPPHALWVLTGAAQHEANATALNFRSSGAWCPVFWAWSRSGGVLIAVALSGAPVPEIEQSSW